MKEEKTFFLNEVHNNQIYKEMHKDFHFGLSSMIKYIFAKKYLVCGIEWQLCIALQQIQKKIHKSTAKEVRE